MTVQCEVCPGCGRLVPPTNLCRKGMCVTCHKQVCKLEVHPLGEEEA
jgi:hypothetical protein